MVENAMSFSPIGPLCHLLKFDLEGDDYVTTT
ncbi:MAG: hypothetical protein ACI8PW_000069 [Methylophilaceae bacterium]|jgi:hypothetical protein